MKQLILLIILLVYFGYSPFSQLIINEIYADPEPSIGLPEAEYVELLNVSNEVVGIAGWEFSDATSTRTILTNIDISPNEVVILCADENEASFSEYGTVVLVSSLPSLNNTGDELTLFTPEGEVSDFVAYEKSWYQDELKENGGWSLERINPINDCDVEANWATSISITGGTPGEENSLFDPSFFDESPLDVEWAFLTENHRLEIQLNKAIQLDVDQFSVSPALSYQSAYLANSNTRLVIEFSNELVEGVIYDFILDELQDCSGLSTTSGVYPFGIAVKPERNEIVINEILFNPSSGGVDFVEIVNITDKLFALDGLSVLELDVNTQQLIDFETIAESMTYLLPFEYFVLTSNASVILEQYENAEEKLIVESSIPNYADEEGIIAIVNESTDTLDILHYYEDWHFEGLNRVDGVSLERISWEAETQSKTNWFSASYLIGNASPTLQNSQMNNQIVPGNEILKLSHRVFTPDNDGIDDFLILSFTNEGMFTGNIQIFDSNGFLVRSLANNQLVGQQNEVRWDGTDEEGNVLPIGHYIIVVSLYDENGNLTRAKKKLVLSKRR